MTHYIRTYKRDGIVEHVATQSTPFLNEPLSVDFRGTPVDHLRESFELAGHQMSAKEIFEAADHSPPGQLNFKPGCGIGCTVTHKPE